MYATPRARALFDEAVVSLRLQRGDSLRLVREAVADTPDFVSALQLEAALLLCSRHPADFEQAGWVYARIAALPQNERERLHTVAIKATVDGDYAAGSQAYDAVLAYAPRDAVALHAASVFDYYLGNPDAIRERAASALKAWSKDMDGYHSVLALHAFGLEECGEYAAAEEAARAALELEPRDLRAQHALTHVLEMQGRAEEGIRLMGSRAAYWTATGSAATHLWWHLALHHLQLGRVKFALELYERRIRSGDGLPELIDASALLWRLQLAGHDVGRRFRQLALAWEPHAEHAHCAFNDLHAMMAFAGAERWDLAHRLLGAQIRRVSLRSGSNHDMTRLVGLPACRALLLYARGDYAAAEGLLRALPPVAHRIGGSHAQRDVLQLTRAAAASQTYRRAA